ncbi:unnamed protein product [Caenorhabditis sp. 36 PRJEB53466]|nr:unnamed protein product [Caenorhabditis sp. 36 PRJEB53466]
MRYLLFLFFQVVLVEPNLLGNYSIEFFDIQIDRNHPEKIYKAFEEFIVKYKRIYKDQAEKTLRFKNFVKSYNKADVLNKKAKEEGHDTKFGINKFSDWSSSEFSGSLSHMPPPSKSDIPMLNITDFFDEVTNKTRQKRKSAKYPEEFDLRDVKVNNRRIVGPVKNQGNCSCCWGFAVTAVTETAYAVNSGQFTPLSDQEICDCGTSGTPGCTGGNLPMGIKYVQQYGQASAEEYPYDETRAKKTKRCRVKSTERVISPKALKLGTVNPRKAEREIIHVLTQWHIPVAVYFQVGENLKAYDAGVIVTDDCYNAEKWHGGAIVGYGSVQDRRGRTVDYWIIKNSWDNDWGESGYFRIKRNIDWCAIEESPVTATFEQ